MKTAVSDRFAGRVKGADQALRDHDDGIAGSHVRVRKLEEQCARARSNARVAWDVAGTGVADGADVEELAATALQRDGKIWALEAAVSTL